MTQKIEPCPCGLTRYPVDVYVQVIPPVTEYNFVHCLNCQRKGPLCNSEADAIAGWNDQRKNDPRRPAGPSAGHAFADAAREWGKPSGTEQEGDES